jgi:hypothetical protein
MLHARCLAERCVYRKNVLKSIFKKYIANMWIQTVLSQNKIQWRDFVTIITKLRNPKHEAHGICLILPTHHHWFGTPAKHKGLSCVLHLCVCPSTQHNVTWRLKAGIVEPERKSIASQRLAKHTFPQQRSAVEVHCWATVQEARSRSNE